MSDTPVCPDHGRELIGTHTKWGRRWACPVWGCSVVWWGRPHTSPADERTRDARQAAHTAFDELWQGKGALLDRGHAYQWLQQRFALEPEDAHIGLFDEGQCEELIRAVRALQRATTASQA